MDRLQRAILINQYKILSYLEPDNKDTYEKYVEALVGGYSLNIGWQFDWIDESRSDEECVFVLDVLSMFETLKNSIERGDLKGLKSDPDTKFRGFDGNDPGEGWCIGYVRYLFENERKFTGILGELKHGFNSHQRMTERYEQMLERLSQYKLSEMPDYCLNEYQIRQIIS